jgi:predicted signal transduction protein with EAL and GGDEF domain
LLRRADVALYAAKAAGSRCRRYTAELDEQADEVARLGADIRNAIDSGQFRLAYQPIVELPHGRTAGVEALIRWEYPVSRSTSSRWTSPSWTASRWPAGTPSSPRR